MARAFIKGLLVVTIASLTFNALTRPPRTSAPPDGADISVGDVRIHYRVWGTHGTPIVLVHGFAESTITWAATAPLLARDHVVYALDLPGAGYSQYTGRYALSDQSQAVAGFIRALHLERPVLLGHSLGAAVVGRTALDAPELVGGVIFADGDAMPFEGRSSDPGLLMRGALRLPYFTSAYRLGTRWDALPRRIFDAQCGSVCHGLEGPNGDRLVSAWMRPLRQGAAEDAMRIMASHAMVHLTPQQVRAISVPRAIIWGEEDATSGGSLGVAQRNFPGARTKVIADAGHLPMVADPAAFAEAVATLTESFTAH